MSYTICVLGSSDDGKSFSSAEVVSYDSHTEVSDNDIINQFMDWMRGKEISVIDYNVESPWYNHYTIDVNWDGPDSTTASCFIITEDEDDGLYGEIS